VCRATVVFQVTAGGRVPILALNYGVKSALGTMENLRDTYERNGEAVDAELRAAAPPPPALASLQDPEQRRIVDTCEALEGYQDPDDEHAPLLSMEWTKLKSPFHSVQMWKKLRKTEKRVVGMGKAEAVVDTSARLAAAWMFAWDSRDKMQRMREQGQYKVVLRQRSPHDVTWVQLSPLPKPLWRREFIFRSIRYVDGGGDVVSASATPQEKIQVDYGQNMKVVRGESAEVVRFTPLGDNQCKVVMHTFRDAAGNLPIKLINIHVPKFLSPIEYARALFQRDDAIDGAERSELAGIIEHEQQIYEEEEEQFIAHVQGKLGGLKEEDFKELESPDHLVKMHSIHVERSSTGVLRASTVRPPPPPPPFPLTPDPPPPVDR
jgi:hypothetical protein